ALVDYVDRVEGVHEALGEVARARTPLEAVDRAVAACGVVFPRIHRLARALDDARLTDAAAEAAWQDRMKLRHAAIRALIGALAKARLLAPGWTVAAASDLVWGLLSFPTYELLVRERGWSVDAYVERIGATLRAALLRGRRI